MHYIQKHILDELRTVDSRHYAQLKSDEIESGHFRYHLGQLVKDGYVTQLRRGLYGLTTKGWRYVDKLSAGRTTPQHMPKVITYTLLTDASHVLLQQKQKQPYMGLLNMIGGKLHEGELAAEAAVREVHEKTGVHIAPPRLSGVFEIIINAQDDLLSHVIAYVFTAHANAADFAQATITPINIKNLPQTPNLAPDFLPIFNKIHNTSGVCTDTLKLQLQPAPEE